MYFRCTLTSLTPYHRSTRTLPSTAPHQFICLTKHLIFLKLDNISYVACVYWFSLPQSFSGLASSKYLKKIRPSWNSIGAMLNKQRTKENDENNKCVNVTCIGYRNFIGCIIGVRFQQYSFKPSLENDFIRIIFFFWFCPNRKHNWVLKAAPEHIASFIRHIYILYLCLSVCLSVCEYFYRFYGLYLCFNRLDFVKLGGIVGFYVWLIVFKFH